MPFETTHAASWLTLTIACVVFWSSTRISNAAAGIAFGLARWSWWGGGMGDERKRGASHVVIDVRPHCTCCTAVAVEGMTDPPRPTERLLPYVGTTSNGFEWEAPHCLVRMKCVQLHVLLSTEVKGT